MYHKVNGKKLKERIMRKSILTLAGIVLTAVGVFAASSHIMDDERVIKYDELPLKARNFIKEHFPNEQPVNVMEDKEFTHTEYMVAMASGTKIDFNADGEWTEVDCRERSVPKGVVPDKIDEYIKRHHPAGMVVEIQRERNKWEVKLNSGLELTFDSSYRLTEIDD